MFKISEAAVHVVGADSRSAVSEYDQAYVASLRLAANAIDGIKDAGLPVGQSQRLYRTFNDSFAKLMEGRAGLVSAISQLLVVHKHSSQAEVDAGCPRPWFTEFFVSGENAGEVTNAGMGAAGTGSAAECAPAPAGA